MSGSATIGVSNFQPGMSVELDYTAPTSYRFLIVLKNDQDDELLLVQPRYTEDALVLNAKISGNYGEELRPSGYDFTPGVEGKIVIEAGEDAFRIYQNAQFLAQFVYRAPVDKVTSVNITSEGSDVIFKRLGVILQ